MISLQFLLYSKHPTVQTYNLVDMYRLSGRYVLVVLCLVVGQCTFLGGFRQDVSKSRVLGGKYGNQGGNYGNQGGNRGGNTKVDTEVDPECYMNSSQLIADNGYIPETHSVTTDDGYILHIFRVRPKRGRIWSRKNFGFNLNPWALD